MNRIREKIIIMMLAKKDIKTLLKKEYLTRAELYLVLDRLESWGCVKLGDEIKNKHLHIAQALEDEADQIELCIKKEDADDLLNRILSEVHTKK